MGGIRNLVPTALLVSLAVSGAGCGPPPWADVARATEILLVEVHDGMWIDDLAPLMTDEPPTLRAKVTHRDSGEQAEGGVELAGNASTYFTLDPPLCVPIRWLDVAPFDAFVRLSLDVPLSWDPSLQGDFPDLTLETWAEAGEGTNTSEWAWWNLWIGWDVGSCSES